MNVPQTSSFLQGISLAAAQASSRYRKAGDRARIAKAVTLILDGHVTLHADQTATVLSQTDASVTYHVTSACPCPDFARAEGGRCKHRYAKALLARVHRLLASAWYAFHEDAQGLQTPGIAVRCDGGDDWFFLPEDQREGWDAHLPSLVLLGRVLVVEAQRAADGNLVAKVCGY